MKNLILTVLTITLANTALAQKNFLDQPYIETMAKADSLVTPDRIYLSIFLNEADSKNKKSVEEQEKLLENILLKLNLDIRKDLTLLDLSSNYRNSFLKGQDIIKAKMYSLLVRDAVITNKLLFELETVQISNVSVDRTEYSKEEELLLDLKSKAIKKSLFTAKKLVEPLDQKVGRALFISDSNIGSKNSRENVTGTFGAAPIIKIRGMSSIYGSSEPIYTEFDKLKFEVQVNAKYSLE